MTETSTRGGSAPRVPEGHLVAVPPGELASASMRFANRPGSDYSGTSDLAVSMQRLFDPVVP